VRALPFFFPERESASSTSKESTTESTISFINPS
jgi:hypothetical protein